MDRKDHGFLTRLYDIEALQVHGDYGKAQLLDVSARHTYYGASGTLPKSILTLRGFIRSFDSFCPDLQFRESQYTLQHKRKYRLVSPDQQPGSLADSYIKLGVVDEDRFIETSHEMWLDTPIIPANAQSALQSTIVLRIANFRPRNSRWWTYHLILEPVPLQDDSFLRLGIMRVLIDHTHDEPTTIDESVYEWKTVKII